MYNPSFATKPNGVPVVSKNELDVMGEEFVNDFQPDVLRNPSPVDIEYFVEFYRGMKTDYQLLSHNGIYLGMTVFENTDKIPIYDPIANRAEYIHADARTVIIDNRLLEDNQEHRYRFTLGHEVGHDILHPEYFSHLCRSRRALSKLLGGEFNNEEPMIQCRVDSSTVPKKSPKDWTDKERMEWQANRFSSAILMPKTAVGYVFDLYDRKDDLNNIFACAGLVHDVANVFNVSPIAAEIRLKELGYIKRKINPDLKIESSVAGLASLMRCF